MIAIVAQALRRARDVDPGLGKGQDVVLGDKTAKRHRTDIGRRSARHQSYGAIPTEKSITPKRSATSTSWARVITPSLRIALLT